MTNQEIKETLEKIGFTRNESKVYLALMGFGISLASDIAKKSNLHRRPVYDALNRLTEKGLVSYVIKSGKKYFQTANPEKIITILKERENEVKMILPELFLKYKEIKPNLKAEIYEGKEGLKTVMELILKEKEEWLSIGSTGKGNITLPYFIPQWQKRKEKLKINYRVLIANTLEGRKNAENYSKMKFAKYKFLPKNIRHPQTIWIFGSYVAIILVSIEHPIIFLIENKEIALSFKQYFEWFWDISK